MPTDCQYKDTLRGRIRDLERRIEFIRENEIDKLKAELERELADAKASLQD